MPEKVRVERMINTKKGMVILTGNCAEIIADFGCITASIINFMVDKGLDIESVEEIIDDVVKISKENSRSKCKKEHEDRAETILKKILGMEV